MRNIFVIARKEFKLFFVSPIAYAVALATFAFIGIVFYGNLLSAISQQSPLSVQVVSGPMVFLLLITSPAITMRSLAEEQKAGTMETLLTAPIRDWEVVVGKWLGGMFFYLLIYLVTLVYPIILNTISSPGIDQGLMIANYLGLILLTGSFLAIGVFTSSLFSNQIAAYFVSMAILLIFWLIGYLSGAANSGGGGVLSYLDLSEHFYNSFFNGIIELKDVVYYLSVMILALVLGSVSVETRRWR